MQKFLNLGNIEHGEFRNIVIADIEQEALVACDKSNADASSLIVINRVYYLLISVRMEFHCLK